MEKMNVKPATGKLGVLCVGLGAVYFNFYDRCADGS